MLYEVITEQAIYLWLKYECVLPKYIFLLLIHFVFPVARPPRTIVFVVEEWGNIPFIYYLNRNNFV